MAFKDRIRPKTATRRENLTGEHISEAGVGFQCSSCDKPIEQGKLIWCRAGTSQARHAPACPRPEPFKRGLKDLFPDD